MSGRAAHRLLLVAALALAAVGPATARVIAGAPSPKPRLAARDLLADRLWDDGRAEITLYEGTIERYGKVRPLKARIIVVKEDMDTLQRVKSATGPGPGTRPVLKQNFIQDFRTGTYDYHQMCSTFLDRATGRVEKLAMSSTEGCGITYVELRASANGAGRHFHSYWDGDAGRDRGFILSDGPPVVFADALPLWLRRLDLRRAQRFVVPLVPSQVSSRVAARLRVHARIEVVGTPDRYGLPVRIEDLDAPDRRRVDRRVDRYWFDPGWPHPLVRFEGGNDPTVLTRVRTTRLAYWNETDPGDEKLLEGGR